MRQISRLVVLLLFMLCLISASFTMNREGYNEGKQDGYEKGLLECIHPTPTLTGEYGQPDGRENLTGPYVE